MVPGVGLLLVIADLEIDHVDAAGAGGGDDPPVGLHYLVGPGDVDAGQFEHATLRREGVLHVHHDDGRLGRIDLDRFGFRGHQHHVISPL